MALAYSDLPSEHAAVRTRAGLFDLSYHDKLRLRGSDRVGFLHGQCTQDLRSLRPGDARPAALLAVEGTLVADFRVVATEEVLILDLEPGALEPVRAALERFLIMEDVTLEDASSELALLSLQGPSAREVLAEAAGVPPETPPREALEALAPGQAGAAYEADRTGYGGVDLLLPREAAADAWRRLTAPPAAAQPAGEGCLEVLRVEAGLPRWGRDLDSTVIPLEAWLHGAISTTKGCYTGQEIIARILSRGRPAKSLMGLIPERGGLRPGDTLEAEGRAVGRVTSVAGSVRLGREIALGYVRKEHAAPGRTLAARGEAGSLAVRVSDLPFGEAA